MNLLSFLDTAIISVSSKTLFIIVGLAALGFAIASLILTFHWSNYSIDKKSLIKVETVYFLGGILLLALAVISIVLV